MMPTPRTLVACCLALVVAGCSVLGPRTDGSRYFLLRPLAEPGAGPALDDLVLGVGPVTLPDYLDRIEMLDLVGPYELRYSRSNRWVEPLGTQVERTLSTNLETLLRPDAVLAFPWYAADAVDLRVEVAFDAIRLDETGVWRGSAEWVLRNPGGGAALERNAFSFELGRDSIPPDVIARGLSTELGRLSGEIAAGVRRHHARSP